MTFVGWIIAIVVVLLLAFALIGSLVAKSTKAKSDQAEDKPTINITITGHFTVTKEDSKNEIIK